jgi:hypothetical protein
MADLYIHNEGTIFLLYALTVTGRNWVAEHIPADAQKFGLAIVVEHRFIRHVVVSAIHDGLEVS